MKIGFGYLRAKLFPRRNEKTLEDFLINRFGAELYLTFFKSYTEKVWGVPCNQISAEWGAQRIKGLSLRTAVVHFLKKAFSRQKPGDISQKSTETSLIEKFLYPKYGPGQLWEYVADLVTKKGGEVRMGWRATKLHVEGDRVVSVAACDPYGATHTIPVDYVFSTMPVRELIHSLDGEVPAEIRAIADGLVYRDFITVGLLVDRLAVTEPDGGPLKDTWIYIQEPDVLVGRLQIFNNWSPYMVADPTKIWIGLEYFCYETDSSGICPTLRSCGLRSPKSRRSGSSARTRSAIQLPSGFPRPTRPTLAPTTDSTKSSAIPTGSRTSSSSAATACTNTTTRIIPCSPR